MICCAIRHVNLDDKPIYKALSYVWGDPNKTLPILVDGKSYQVTVNCHAALERLREIGEKTIWIDAICINQKDDDEKSQQVGFMREIYHCTQEVIIWLGRSREEREWEGKVTEKRAIDLVARLKGKDWSLESRMSVEQPKLCNEIIRKLMEAGKNQDDWNAFTELCSHPWFYRLWVYQELVAPPKRTILVQYHTFAFGDLGDAALTIFTADEIPPPLAMLHGEEFYRRLQYVTTAVLSRFSHLMLFDWKKGEKARPLFLMNISTTWKCFDPRDRVFALLGDIDDGRVRPDYTKSLKEVYLGATQFLISLEAPFLEAPLAVLSSAGLTNRHEQNDLDIPSWIVDWRCNLKNGLQGGKYCADFGRTPNISFAEDNIILEVAGVCVDTVLATKNLRVSVEHLMKDGSRWDTLEQGFALWQEHFDFYPNNYDAEEIGIRTLTLDIESNTMPIRRLPYNHMLEYKKLWSAKFDPQRDDPKELFPMGDRDPNNYDKWAAEFIYRFGKRLSKY